VAARQLTELGYRVLEAENAEAALHIVSSSDRIDLLFTDVVMPGSIDGIELARLVGRLRPRPEILLASGFPEGRAPGQEPCPPEFRLLGKPYNLDELAHAVRDTLAGRRDDETSDRHAHPNPMSAGHPGPMSAGHPGPMSAGRPGPMSAGHPDRTSVGRTKASGPLKPGPVIRETV
jgi:DNA-binding NtrC family response regulator